MCIEVEWRRHCSTPTPTLAPAPTVIQKQGGIGAIIWRWNYGQMAADGAKLCVDKCGKIMIRLSIGATVSGLTKGYMMAITSQSLGRSYSKSDSPSKFVYHCQWNMWKYISEKFCVLLRTQKSEFSERMANWTHDGIFVQMHLLLLQVRS